MATAKNSSTKPKAKPKPKATAKTKLLIADIICSRILTQFWEDKELEMISISETPMDVFDFSTAKNDYKILNKEKKDGDFIVTIETQNKPLIKYLTDSPDKINFHAKEKIVSGVVIKK